MSQTSEFSLIKTYFSALTPERDDVTLGIGDDCALLAPPANMELATSVDTLVSGVHFFADVDPYKLGHKALAVNLSDLAAMGAQPAWFTLERARPRSRTMYNMYAWSCAGSSASGLQPWCRARAATAAT